MARPRSEGWKGSIEAQAHLHLVAPRSLPLQVADWLKLKLIVEMEFRFLRDSRVRRELTRELNRARLVLTDAAQLSDKAEAVQLAREVESERKAGKAGWATQRAALKQIATRQTHPGVSLFALATLPEDLAAMSGQIERALAALDVWADPRLDLGVLPQTLTNRELRTHLLAEEILWLENSAFGKTEAGGVFLEMVDPYRRAIRPEGPVGAAFAAYLSIAVEVEPRCEDPDEFDGRRKACDERLSRIRSGGGSRVLAGASIDRAMRLKRNAPKAKRRRRSY